MYQLDSMFSDDSINIHYKAPTSRLLKMNTFNEFELARMKKLYKDELNSRLQRSKSTRLSASSNQHKRPQQLYSQGCHFSEQRRRTQSAERLLPPSSHYFNQRTPESSYSPPFIDLNRYEHAFISKNAKARHRMARFGRALFNFQAKSERELSLKRGDLVELIEMLDHTWAQVEDCQSGLQGLVPLNYIDFGVGCAVAKRDVSGQQQVVRTSYGGSSSTSAPQPMNKATKQQTIDSASVPLLPMSKGEPITLIRRLSGHWYEASNTRQAIGLVWSNDLDIIKQPVLSDKDNRPEDCRRPASTRPASRFSSSGLGMNDGNDCDADDDGDDDEDDDDEGEFSDYEGGGGDLDGCLNHHHHGQNEMLLCNNDTAEHVLARRRRARSTSGLQGQIYHATNRCCAQNINNPDLQQAKALIGGHGSDLPPTDYCCGHTKTTNQCGAPSTGSCMQLPRRSSSSPYISSAGLRQQPSLYQATQEKACQKASMGAVSATETSQLPRLCRAKYAYKARQKDELELVVGDILMVVHECDDGWFIGSSYTTKEMGTFPGNFVEPV